MTIAEIKSIKQNSDIVKVIGHFVELKRDGANYTASCPFHNERSKSFTVSASKNIFKCFGCGKSGDVIDFVISHTGKSKNEAIKWIADTQNITLDPGFVTKEYIEPPTDYLPEDIFRGALLKGSRSNNFRQWLYSIYPLHDLQHHISTSKHWPGAVIFWYIDINWNVRSGKIMQYNPETGKRVKEPKPLITWVHKVLRLPNFNFDTCLYGEHLLNRFLDKTVCIVESEKTAIVASIKYPGFIWLASGSLTNLTYKRCHVLKGRKIVLYPDVGAEERWLEKMNQLQELIPGQWSMKMIQSKPKGYDLCDYILDNL